MANLRTARGLDRVVNFTDAAVAISITLLVLPLIDLGNEVVNHPLGYVLGQHWQNILAFVISFAVVGNMWLVHHQLFELVRDYNRGLAVLNLLWLGGMTALPFSTNIVANATPASAVYALYLGNIFLVSGSALLIRFYLSRNRELLRPEVVDELHVAASTVPTAILLIAGVLATLFPTIGATWLLLMFGGAPIERAIIRRQRRRAQPAT
ncbi:MAG TPA: TMEM175 family protein [Galbitalea sp.]|nr:TMEM175 family protein [Galbitalea sp.]